MHCSDGAADVQLWASCVELLKSGADAHTTDTCGNTPLDVILKKENLDVSPSSSIGTKVELLLNSSLFSTAPPPRQKLLKQLLDLFLAGAISPVCNS